MQLHLNTLKVLVGLLIFFGSQSTKAQYKHPDRDYDNKDLDDVPRYPGKLEGLLSEIGSHIKYPPYAARKGIQGRVYVEFVVQIDGTIREPKVVKGIGAGCDEEAIKALKKLSKKFTPAIKDGELVETKMVIPILFSLN